MAGPMTPYIVRQGDYLAKIAFLKGFDADEVWNDPKNDDLRTLRPNPNILAPGDVLYVPSAPVAKPLALSQGTENSYSASAPKISIKVTFTGYDGPYANEPYEVEGMPDAAGTSDGDGTVSIDIGVHVREIQITFPGKGAAFSIRIGDIDPITETTGVRQRLCNLGYIGVYPEGAAEDAQKLEDSLAIMRFQLDQGLPPSGEVDDATSQALSAAHKS